ncbi:hypothetical protein BJX76DRAFT_130122 [Aspergillus varians]
MEKSEILVHISAPSGAVDDARYRAQVEAILNFQTHSRERIGLIADEAQPSSSHPNTPSPLKATNTIDLPPRVPSFPSYPGPKRHSSQKDSLDTPVSVIPDSQPQPPAFDAESLSLHPEPPLCSPYRSPKRPRVDSPPSLDHSCHDEAQHNYTEHRIITAPVTSTITNTPLGPDIPKSQNEPKQSQSQPQNSKPQQNPSSTLLLTLPLEIKPPPPPISSSPFTTHITPTLEMLAKRLRSPRTYSPTTQTRSLNSLERGYWYLHLRINLAPEVNPSNLSPSPSFWDKPLFSRFWTFLSDFISEEGRAGWGVWCILEDEDEDQNEVMIPAPQETDGDGEPNTTTAAAAAAAAGHARSEQSVSLKVYAWGEIACHIYLLLFLASERRVRKMGAQWLDSRDEIVIQMP